MTVPMSEAELLAKLRGGFSSHMVGWCHDLLDHEALALLTSWRDEAVRVERERAILEAATVARTHLKKRQEARAANPDANWEGLDPEATMLAITGIILRARTTAE